MADREKVHGTEDNAECGNGEKNEEQINAKSGFKEEDGTAKEEADGKDEELSSDDMTQKIHKTTEKSKRLQDNLMQSLKEKANSSDSHGPDGEVEIGAHVESKAVSDYNNRLDGESVLRSELIKYRALLRRKKKKRSIKFNDFTSL